MSSVDLDQFVEDVSRRLEAIEAKLNAGETTDISNRHESDVSVDKSSFLTLYDVLFDKIGALATSSAGLDDKLEKMVQDIRGCFTASRGIIELASKCRKPKAEELQEVLQPVASALKKAQKNRLPAGFVNHEKALLEGISAVMWVNPAIGSPVPYLESMRDASVFYANKVRISNKGTEKGDLHMKWCSQLNDVFQGLLEVVGENQKMGLDWNPRGSPPSKAQVSVEASETKVKSKAKSTHVGSASANLFAELSKIDQSSGKTAGLRHVSDDMKSKNQKNRSAVVKAMPKPKVSGSTPKGREVVKDPVFELKGNKWTIEYQRDGAIKTIEADQLGMKRTVYIYKCTGSATIILKGKCNNITLDSCHDVQLLFDNVVGACEIVNCKKVKVQANVAVPTVSIDKCDGVLLYLMQRDILPTVQLVTSKSSEMNVSWPSANPDENFIERPIPEQYVSKILDEGTIDTQVSDLYSH